MGPLRGLERRPPRAARAGRSASRLLPGHVAAARPAARRTASRLGGGTAAAGSTRSVVVDGQHDHRARVLQHQPPERLARPGRRGGVPGRRGAPSPSRRGSRSSLTRRPATARRRSASGRVAGGRVGRSGAEASMTRTLRWRHGRRQPDPQRGRGAVRGCSPWPATTSTSTSPGCWRVTPSAPSRRSPSPAPSPARRPSSTASPTWSAPTLNGRPSTPRHWPSGRLPLTDLAGRQRAGGGDRADRHRAAPAAILRTVDPSDGLVYVWTSFEPDEARRLWACFDQPDLKAPHRFVVDRPGDVDRHLQHRPRAGRPTPADGARVWTFPDTPRLSTYVVVVNAGPFHEVRAPARRLRPRLLLPPVAGRGPRARPRRPGDDHPAGAGVLRRAVRHAVPAAALRPGLRPRPRRRDGELGVRHLRRRAALPHARPATRSGRCSRSSCSTRWRTCGSATW